MLNMRENSRKIKWNLPSQQKARGTARKAWCQKPSGAPGQAISAPLSPDGNTGGAPSCPRRHRHPPGPGRRTSLAPSRLPLARPGQPPRRAGRAGQGWAGQSRGKGSPPPPPLPPPTSDSARGCREAGACRAAPSRRGGRPPPPCPGPAPRYSGRLGAAPRLPQKPAGAQAGGLLPAPPHPTQTPGAAAAVAGCPAARGAHAAPGAHPPGDRGPETAEPGEAASLGAALGGLERKIPPPPPPPPRRCL